jgi:hypothetical protein
VSIHLFIACAQSTTHISRLPDHMICNSYCRETEECIQTSSFGRGLRAGLGVVPCPIRTSQLLHQERFRVLSRYQDWHSIQLDHQNQGLSDTPRQTLIFHRAQAMFSSSFHDKNIRRKILSPEMCSSRIEIHTSLLDQKLQNHPCDGCESYIIMQMLCCLLSEDKVNLHFHLILHISFCNIGKMNPPTGHLGRLISFELGQQDLFQASLVP